MYQREQTKANKFDVRIHRSPSGAGLPRFELNGACLNQVNVPCRGAGSSARGTAPSRMKGLPELPVRGWIPIAKLESAPRAVVVPDCHFQRHYYVVTERLEDDDE